MLTVQQTFYNCAGKTFNITVRDTLFETGNDIRAGSIVLRLSVKKLSQKNAYFAEALPQGVARSHENPAEDTSMDIFSSTIRGRN